MKKKPNPPTVYDCMNQCIWESRRRNGEDPKLMLIGSSIMDALFLGFHKEFPEDFKDLSYNGVKLVATNAPGIWCAVQVS